MSQTIIVTGASRGIGLAVARFLLKENHNVFLVARTEEPMRKLKEEFPGRVEYLAADLADFENGPKAISLALAAFSKIDALILNHGTLHPLTRLADSSPTDFRAAFDTNFFSFIAFIQPAIPHLRSTTGRIILISSGAATSAYATWGAYGASKAALNHLALTLAAEEPALTTLALRPGTVDTDMQAVIRGSAAMDEKDAVRFKSLWEDGKLLAAEVPGNVVARLAVGAGRELSGKFVSWNDAVLEKFQD